jgi:hypothetical protein
MNYLRMKYLRRAAAACAIVIAMLATACAQPNAPSGGSAPATSAPAAPAVAPAQAAAQASPVAAAGGTLSANTPGDQTGAACGPGMRTAQTQATGSTSDTDWSLPSGWFFTQTGDSSDRGFSIVDDGGVQMFSEFQRLGGWRSLGFPASRRFNWHGTMSQATQRAILQWSPVTGQVDFANVLDLMHEDGRDDDLRVQKQIPPPTEVDEAGLTYETIAARRLAWLDARPAIKAKYCNAPGGADPVQLWGLPSSKATNMSAAGEVYVLRTQRAAFQEWVNGADWAAPGEVTVVLAGDLAKEFNLLPSEATILESAPAH